MARSTTSMKKKSYIRYSEAYRQEALAPADRIGVAAAARELGLHSSQLYQRHSKGSAAARYIGVRAVAGRRKRQSEAAISRSQ
ncbi:hypothetical protein ACSTAY_11755 [Vreelandella alkaliphila]